MFECFHLSTQIYYYTAEETALELKRGVQQNRILQIRQGDLDDLKGEPISTSSPLGAPLLFWPNLSLASFTM